MMISYRQVVEEWLAGFGKKDVLLHQLTSFAGEREMVRMFGAEYPYTKNASCMHYPKAGSPV